MQEPPRLMDDTVLFWWLFVIMLGAGITAGSSTERLDVQGAMGLGLLVLGAAMLYRLGLNRTPRRRN